MRSAIRSPADPRIHPFKLAGLSAAVGVFTIFLLLFSCIARSSLWKLRYLPFHIRGIEQIQSLCYLVNNLSNVSTCPRCHLRNCLGANQHLWMMTTSSCPTYHKYFQQRMSPNTSMLPHPPPCRPLHLRLHQLILRWHRPSTPSFPNRTSAFPLASRQPFYQLATHTGSSDSVICSWKLLSSVDHTFQTRCRHVASWLIPKVQIEKCRVLFRLTMLPMSQGTLCNLLWKQSRVTRLSEIRCWIERAGIIHSNSYAMLRSNQSIRPSSPD